MRCRFCIAKPLVLGDNEHRWFLNETEGNKEGDYDVYDKENNIHAGIDDPPGISGSAEDGSCG